MGRLEEAIQVLIRVVLRKNILVFREVALLAVGFTSVMVSTIRFSRVVFRPTEMFAGRYSSVSSMGTARHGRQS